MRRPVNPPNHPGDEMGKGNRNCYRHNFIFDLFCTTISRFPFPTRVLTHPPTWTETNSRQTYHEFAFITFWDLALRGRVGLRSEVTRAAN